MRIEAMIAVPKPSITKEVLNNACVIMSVIALITMRNNPNVRIVIGKVKITSNGLSNTFKIAKITLARIAVPIPSMWNDVKI